MIQSGDVGLERTGRDLVTTSWRISLSAVDEAHQAEILAVFGPGDNRLDWEFLQDFVRPAVTDKLSGFWRELALSPTRPTTTSFGSLKARQ